MADVETIFLRTFSNICFIHEQPQDELKISSLVNKINGKTHNIYQFQLMKALILHTHIQLKSLYLSNTTLKSYCPTKTFYF